MHKVTYSCEAILIICMNFINVHVVVSYFHKFVGSGSLRNESGVYQHATLGAPGSTAPLLTQIKEEKEVLYLPPLIPCKPSSFNL